MTEAMFEEIGSLLEEEGLLLKRGTIVDATIIHAPTSTKSASAADFSLPRLLHLGAGTRVKDGVLEVLEMTTEALDEARPTVTRVRPTTVDDMPCFRPGQHSLTRQVECSSRTAHVVLVSIIACLPFWHPSAVSGQEGDQGPVQRVKEVEQVLQDGRWTDTRRGFYHYDDRGRLTERLWQTLDADQWQHSMRHLRAYSDEVLTELVIQVRRNGKWHTVATQQFLIDSAGVTTGRRDTRYTDDGTPEVDVHWRYTFASGDIVVDEVGMAQTEEGAEPVGRTERRFDSRGQPVEQRFPVWKDGAWQPARRMLLEYNNLGHHVRSLRQEWDAGQWRNTVRYVMIVDERGRRLSELWQRWTEEEWVDFRRVTYEYK